MFLKLRKKFKSYPVVSHYHTDFLLTRFIHAHRFLLEEGSFMNSPPIPALKTEATGWHLDRHSNLGRVSTPPKTVRSSCTSAGCMWTCFPWGVCKLGAAWAKGAHWPAPSNNPGLSFRELQTRLRSLLGVGDWGMTWDLKACTWIPLRPPHPPFHSAGSAVCFHCDNFSCEEMQWKSLGQTTPRYSAQYPFKREPRASPVSS